MVTQRRGLEGLLGFYLLERFGVSQALARLDADDGHLGIGCVDAHDGSRADRGALVAGVIEDPFRSRLHLAQILDGGRIRHAVPDGFVVAHEIVEGVDAGLGFEEVVGHIQV